MLIPPDAALSPEQERPQSIPKSCFRGDEPRVALIFTAPLMKQERLNALVLRKWVFSSETHCHIKRCKNKSVGLHLILRVAAEENILIVEAVIHRHPGKLMLRRIGEESPGTKGDAVAYPADVSHGVPVGIIVCGERPGRADVIVPEKIVGPLFRMDYKAVVVNQKDEIGPDVRCKLIDHEVIELVDAVNLLTVPVMNPRRKTKRLPVGDEDGIAKVNSPHGVFHGLDGFIDFHAAHGDQRDIRKLKLPVAVFHGCDLP